MSRTSPSPPVVMTLAGSDCSAGAGLQADLKTFSALGVYGVTVVTAVVAESPATVTAVQPLSPALVAQQYDLLLRSFPVAALKTGLLGSREIIEEITPRLASFAGPVIIDPVSIASSGQSLSANDCDEALRALIAKAATLVTPNRAEAEAFLRSPIRNSSGARDAAIRIASEWGCAVLLKGGHIEGAESTDWLVHAGGIQAVTRQRIAGGSSLHGTGCTYAAAIAAELAYGKPVPEAVEAARCFLHRACEHPYRWKSADGSFTKALAHGELRMQS